MSKRYAIKTPQGYVAGFNHTHQVVQVAGRPDRIKKFVSMTSALGFINRYADAGYGLESETAEVKEV